MSDAQLKQRLVIKHRLIIACVLLLVALGLFYFRYVTEAEWVQYQSDKQQEEVLQSQVDMLTQQNSQLTATIEETGKELVSFSEDKIKYINLASDLSLKHSIRINKLTVSDVWTETTLSDMSVMTTTVEVEGSLSNVRAFVEEYCGTNYTNRINVVSCRPSGRYVWLQRKVDGEKVLNWFDLTEDEELYQELMDEEEDAAGASGSEFGIPVVQEDSTANYVYDEETGSFIDQTTGLPVDPETLDITPITLDKMFADWPMKVYLVIDFLGRA